MRTRIASRLVMTRPMEVLPVFVETAGSTQRRSLYSVSFILKAQRMLMLLLRDKTQLKVAGYTPINNR